MDKIWLIIVREYSVRVRKKSFIIMTLVTPLLLGMLIFAPSYLNSISSDLDQEVKNIAIIEENAFFSDKIMNSDLINFTQVPESEKELIKNSFEKSSYHAIVEIENNQKINILSKKQINKITLNQIENQIFKIKENQNYLDANIDINLLNSLSPKLSFNYITLNDDGEETSSNYEVKSVISFIFGFLIYIFIFMYGSMVMRGVIEEKSNRIVEVIISSVKPFQLLIGKIIGVALVGFTQFILWIILSLFVANSAEVILMQDNQLGFLDNISLLSINIDISLLLSNFIFYFVGGYLLYSSFFACIGAAVDNESDVQQMILPITIPLILSLSMMESIMNNPDGVLAFWMSIFPLSSPIVMMARLPFGGVESWELILSLAILILSFLLSTWISSRIYRIGILMYGKKASYKELIKWIRFKG
tara:strand:- start:209 stop:1462 length:1254 start_codon:yes stop_codon:yes gene_type:complete